MRWISHMICVCVVVIQLSHSLPLEPQPQETLRSIDEELGQPNSEHSDVRDKRTVGVFRRIFPELSKIIDDKIQQITRVVFRVVGRAVLGGGLGGGGGGGGGGDGDGDGGRRISITLPTYPPDPEDEEDTEEPDTTEENSSDNAIPDEGSDGEEQGGASALSEAASEVKEVRVPFPSETNNDLQAAASGEDNDEAESSQEEVSDDIDISESGENTRSKRLGVFGNLFGGASGGASAGGGSGGGSGNFLFDIIRTAADGAARSAGTVYRFLAGTDTGLSLTGYNNDLTVPTVGVAIAAPSAAAAAAPPAPPPPPQAVPPPPANPTITLVAGSGQTEQQDENANAPLGTGDQQQPAPPAAQPADDGYQAGIPGPITRLFVIANRGIANLVQDLILRLAQTSERIVNFKARLITAII